MCMEFRTFWNKKEEYPSLIITEIIASAHHSVINVLTGPKHCWSQHGTTIFLFFDDFEINSVKKCLN